jgi:hypothetical protein
MTTVTTTQPTPALPKQQAAASPQDFYRQQRAGGLSHAEAVTLVCQTFNYRQEQEVERWLTQARRDFETPPPPVVEPEPEQQQPALPEDALRRDAERKIAEAEAVEARLSYDALGDDPAIKDAVQRELEDVRSERRSAEGSLRQAELAGVERARRAVAEDEEREREARERALEQARRLDGRVRAKAKAVDSAAVALAAEIRGHREIVDRQVEHFQQAGVPQDQPIPARYEGALRFHFVAAGVDGFFHWRSGWPSPGELAPLAQEEEGAK